MSSNHHPKNHNLIKKIFKIVQTYHLNQDNRKLRFNNRQGHIKTV